MAADEDPSARYGFIDCGVPRPTVKTCPVLPASRTACATPGADDVHSPTSPVRSGWAFIRSVAGVDDVDDLSVRVLGGGIGLLHGDPGIQVRGRLPTGHDGVLALSAHRL